MVASLRGEVGGEPRGLCAFARGGEEIGMSIHSKEYLGYAECCKRWAETTEDIRSKQDFVRLSESFLMCAQLMEKCERPVVADADY